MDACLSGKGSSRGVSAAKQLLCWRSMVRQHAPGPGHHDHERTNTGGQAARGDWLQHHAVILPFFQTPSFFSWSQRRNGGCSPRKMIKLTPSLCGWTRAVFSVPSPVRLFLFSRAAALAQLQQAACLITPTEPVGFFLVHTNRQPSGDQLRCGLQGSPLHFCSDRLRTPPST